MTSDTMVFTRYLTRASVLLLLLFTSFTEAQNANMNEGDPQDLLHPHADDCSWTGGACEWDYNMEAMTVKLEGGRMETFYAYMDPDVSTFYNETEGQLRVMEPSFHGQLVKFVNQSPKPIQIHWDNKNNNEQIHVSDVEAFGSASSVAYPNMEFQVRFADNPNKVLLTWKIAEHDHIYSFDPFKGKYEVAYQKLKSDEQFQKYLMQHNNHLFGKQYRAKTGREWFGLYGQRFPPRYHMWQAEFLGQSHTITTKEIHFVEYPPDEELAKGISLYGPRPEEITRNRKYRDTYPTMNLTMTAISCRPRVFEIPNFLSDLEIDHIQKVSQEKQAAGIEEDSKLLIGRHQSIILDAIYRRAADVMQIDEKLFRYRRKLEVPEFSESKVGIAEDLQLDHYEAGQQYMAQHDFSMPGLVRGQPSRFATLMLYLNEGMEGGETSFPLWRNAETSQALRVKPEKGKAVLIYNILPDGNYDELSMHAGEKVISGEKWLANLWVWDPVLAHA